MKSFGAQVAYALSDLNLILGTIFGPEQDDNNKTFRVLVDFIANYSTDIPRSSSMATISTKATRTTSVRCWRWVAAQRDARARRAR